MRSVKFSLRGPVNKSFEVLKHGINFYISLCTDRERERKKKLISRGMGNADGSIDF
jgi:hypothetical protein